MHCWAFSPITGFWLLAAALGCCCASNSAEARQEYYSALGTPQSPPAEALNIPDPLQSSDNVEGQPAQQNAEYDNSAVLEEELDTSWELDLPQQAPTDACAGGVFACGMGVQNTCGVQDPCGDTSCRPRTRLYGGFEATFLKPRFEENPAFMIRTDDGAGAVTHTDTEFDYDLEFSPRVWLGADVCDGLGWRVSWWQFDHPAATSTASPPANNLGELTHPEFADVDISSTIPTDTFSAASGLNAYTIDLEATKQTGFGRWGLGLSCGLRYAFAEQTYLAQLRDVGNTLLGQINYRHSLEGFGPTMSLRAYRPWSSRLGMYCLARGSVLFGDGASTLSAGEDLDLITPITTTQTTNRDDLLSIGEIQLGLQWRGWRWRALRPFVSTAIEGQVWNGAGNASSETGTLGLFGFNTSLGVDW